MENPIKMDDLGVPLFLETSVFPPPCPHPLHPDLGWLPYRSNGIGTSQARILLGEKVGVFWPFLQFEKERNRGVKAVGSHWKPSFSGGELLISGAMDVFRK